MISYCMALTLAKRNIPCVVYEKSSGVKYVPSESYPIGVNQRGMVVLHERILSLYLLFSYLSPYLSWNR